MTNRERKQESVAVGPDASDERPSTTTGGTHRRDGADGSSSVGDPAGARTSATHRRDTRLATIERLSSGLFHEINNQLMVASANANLLEVDADDEESLSTARAIAHGANTAAALTTAFLSLARPGKRRDVESCDLRDVVMDADRLTRHALARGVRSAIELTPEPLVVRAERRALLEALLVLVLSTGDALEGEGRLTLSLSTTRSPTSSARQAWLDATETGPRRAILRLEDDGLADLDPIEAETFERYARRRFSPSTARDCATVERIIADAGGQIDVAIHPGSGTRVEMTLPLSIAPDPFALEELP